MAIKNFLTIEYTSRKDKRKRKREKGNGDGVAVLWRPFERVVKDTHAFRGDPVCERISCGVNHTCNTVKRLFTTRLKSVDLRTTLVKDIRPASGSVFKRLCFGTSVPNSGAAAYLVLGLCSNTETWRHYSLILFYPDWSISFQFLPIFSEILTFVELSGLG